MDKPANRRFSVMVIDDEPQVTAELSELLENSGYRCVVSDNKDSALQKFRNDSSIGLVICDLGLGRDNGIRVVEALKEIAGNGRFFETIILTGQQGSQEVIEAMRVGVADYYQKPVAPMDLLKGLERLEARLHERIRSQLSLSQVNQRLEYLAESLNSISRDIHKIKYEVHGGGQSSVLKQEASEAPESLPSSAEQIAPVVNNPLFNKLSPRQQAVARLVSKGLTNYQIAYDLGITENTVKLYVSQVLRLMHMHNRTQLALALSPSASPSSAVH
ncbi:two-component response regulator, PprB [Pseudomonas sp. ATCC 13867]|uniref:response regulator transcription factor n=1 Tax=Pseudomonas sp. ATCC 13867 TaxID=1294143 RepID=UPI0002C4F70B|nr:response regulator transcription factor [Pseudomonas sp. ATCC 13867]AGI23053.1 two-component response regulator, PprB [Pseudomonas sp. ATCC 13867]RFQ26259.1 DNA-binding response regulator [Pseudomonas sp. ATCC 13867]